MTKKEYQNKLSEHVIFNGYDYLTGPERVQLSHDVKKRDGVLLPGCNNRATMRKNKNGDLILTSYYTDVAIIAAGQFYKTWHGYSNTTLKHVNVFRRINGLPEINKHDWIMLETV